MKSCCDTKNELDPDVPLTIAMVGNPNVGKSVFFSRLTGVGVDVSNYPGTTVEITKGTVKHEGQSINVVDLPGIYSLSASTEDERVAMKFLIQNRPDVIINVVDATRLTRNLNLTLQLLEIDIPIVVALNQIDAAELEEKNEELERFNKVFIGRELRMAELKKQIAKLEKNAELDKNSESGMK